MQYWGQSGMISLNDETAWVAYSWPYICINANPGQHKSILVFQQLNIQFRLHWCASKYIMTLMSIRKMGAHNQHASLCADFHCKVVFWLLRQRPACTWYQQWSVPAGTSPQGPSFRSHDVAPIYVLWGDATTSPMAIQLSDMNHRLRPITGTAGEQSNQVRMSQLHCFSNPNPSAQTFHLEDKCKNTKIGLRWVCTFPLGSYFCKN